MVEEFVSWSYAWAHYITVDSTQEIQWELAPSADQIALMNTVFRGGPVRVWYGSGGDAPDLGPVLSEVVYAPADMALQKLVRHAEGVEWWVEGEHYCSFFHG